MNATPFIRVLSLDGDSVSHVSWDRRACTDESPDALAQMDDHRDVWLLQAP